jgi:hypothetical protein
MTQDSKPTQAIFGAEVQDSLANEFVPRRTLDDDLVYYNDEDDGDKRSFIDNSLATQSAVAQLASPLTSVSNKRGLTWNIPRIDLIWRSNPYVKRAVDWLSSQPLIKGIDINSSDQRMTSQELNMTQQQISKLYRPLQKVLESGIVYGGSAGLIIIKGRQGYEDYKKPLRIDEIRKGEFMGIKPLARWYQIEPALEKGVIENIGDEYGIYEADLLGQPLYYRVNLSGGLAGFSGTNAHEVKQSMFKQGGTSFLVHRSWLLLFNPYSLSHIETQVERYWSTSIIETAYVDLERHEILWSATAKSAVKNNLGILNMAGFEVTLANNYSRKVIHDKVNLMKETTAHGLVMLGEKDEFKFAESSMLGNEKALEQSMRQLANAFATPISIMFPGLEYDGENYLQSVFNIENLQNKEIRPMYNILIPLIYKSLFGKKIKDFDFKFNTIVTLTPTQKAEIMLTMTEVLSTAYQDNGISLMDYQRMLTDMLENPSNLFHQISEEYIEEVKNGTKDGKIRTHATDQVDIARELNQANGGLSGVEHPASAEGGKSGGDPTKSKGLFKRHVLNREKGKE